MADKVDDKKVDESTEDVEDTNTEETETTEEVEKTAKGFDQAQVNRIVQSRLKKVRAEYDAQIEDLNEQIQEYENTLKSLVEEMKKDLPEDYIELLADASLVKQFKVLSKKLGAKKNMTSTPKENTSGKKKDPTEGLSLMEMKNLR